MNTSMLGTILTMVMTFGSAIFISGCENNRYQNDISADVTTESSFQTPPIAQSYHALLEQRIKVGPGVGLAVVLVDGKQQDFIFTGYSGKGTEQKINKNSLFEIGSITKTFTGILLADMVLKGDVSLDDPAAKYLPNTVNMPSFEGREITLKDLATHSSGLPRLPDNMNPKDPSNPYADYTAEQMYAFLSGYKLDRAIGEEVAYSNLGMGLLGHILERRMGQSYEALITQRILKPLNMSSTFIVVPEREKMNFVQGHDITGEFAGYWNLQTLAGAGALRSSLEDMTIYLKSNMGVIDTPLSEAMSMSHKFQQDLGNLDGFIGLAWLTQNMEDRNVTWHNGGTGGFKSFLGFDSVNQRGVVVLANAQDDVDLIGRSILTQQPDMLKPKTTDTALSFTAEELDRLVGEYQLAPNFSIHITRVDKRLFLQATGQGKAEIFAKSRLEFFLKVVEASITFKENQDDEIVSLVLDQGGVMQAATKQ